MKEARNHRYEGSFFEEKAAKFLQQNGVRILERNFRVRQAEIDIVAETVSAAEAGAGGRRTISPTLLFVEVKARTGKGSGAAGEAVTVSKQEKICRCADSYLSWHGIDPYRQKIRFDVITVNTAANTVGIDWIQDAFPYRAGTGRRRGPYWRVW